MDALEKTFIICPIKSMGGIRLIETVPLWLLLKIFVKDNEEAFHWANNCEVGDEEYINAKYKVIRAK